MTAETRTTCPYCGVGCGIIAGVDGTGAVTVRGDPEHPSNFGRLCSKGLALGDTLDLEGRLLHPEIDGERVDWDAALGHVAARFNQTIAEHGPGSVAFYVSGQLLTEDYYVANKLMKGVIGTANIDTNSRLCMASAVAGHRRAFGTDTVPGCYEDLELADLVVIVGSNLAWCHPVLYQRLQAAKTARPGMKVALIDPRRTMTADIADMHLPIRPDGDVALFTGLLAFLADNQALDRAYIDQHTSGFDAALEKASTLSLESIAEQTGLSDSEITAFYDLFMRTGKTVTLFSQGVNQSAVGTDKVNAIINCHLATGRIGRPGMTPFSVTGQPNAMGGREVGGLATMLAAHMDMDDPKDRDRLARFWGVDRVADKPGLKAVEMFDAVRDGHIKALWIMATNPVDSLPDADHVEAAIRACPFVVVSDVMRDTDTVRHAHVKLPAAAWGEKDGTVTNSERRISRQRPFLTVPGEARPDWWIVTHVARAMGHGRLFPYESAADIFAEHAALSAFENNGSRAFDIGSKVNMRPQDYEATQPFQWPARADALPAAPRLFADGRFFTRDQRARFVAVAPPPTLQTPPGGLALNTGRVRDHWHTLTRTGKSARLSAHSPEPFIELHPDDAGAREIVEDDIVHVTNSARGAHLMLRARITDRQRRGSAFVPMHWTDQLAARARVDTLIPARTDPHSGQPALKNGIVFVARAAIAAHGFAVVRTRPDPAVLTAQASYWALARAAEGWRLELAFDKDPTDLQSLARTLFALTEEAQLLAYHDAKAGDHRIAAFDRERLAGMLFVSPRPVTAARGWIADQLLSDTTEHHTRFRLMAGRPGADQPDQGAIVCACFSVGVNRIVEAVTKGGCMSVDAVGTALKAGTNCGSCRSEIREIVEMHRMAAAE